MTKTFFTIALVLAYFHSLSRENAPLFFKCLYFNASTNCSTAGAAGTVPGTCGLFYFDPCVGMEYNWTDGQGNSHPAKCCSSPMSIYSNPNEIILVPNLEITLDEDFKIVGRNYSGDIFDISNFAHLIPEEWASVKVHLDKDNYNNITLSASKVINSAPYIEESTTVTYTISYQEILDTYLEFTSNSPLQTKIFASPSVEFKFNDENWSGVEVIRQVLNSPIDGHQFITALKVLTIDGKIEETLELKPELINKIDLSGLRKGIYVFILNTDGIETNKKFIKTK